MRNDDIIPPEAAAAPAPPGRSQVFPTGRPPGEPAPVNPEQPEDETQPSEEEQAQFDQLDVRCAKFIWSAEGLKSLVGMLNHASKEIYETVGAAAYQLVKTEADKASRAGVKISADVAFQVAAQTVVPELFLLAEKARIIPEMSPEQEQEQMGMALMETQRLHGDTLLQSKDGPQIQKEAQDHYAQQVAKEADAGELDPNFANMMRGQNGTGTTG